MTTTITLKRLGGSYGIARLAPDAPIPAWADGEGYVSITRSDDELSVVCLSHRIPDTVRRDTGWRCLKFQGPFAFDQAGILLAVIEPLSRNGIGVFVVSTFDTDHLLLQEADYASAERLLAQAGHCLD
jgi:uncharacterized protein